MPNPEAALVTLGDITREFPAHAGPLMAWLGLDLGGKPVYIDLARMPHLLIAGSTGTGKSVCLNALLASVLLRSTPDDLRMILIDPKKVELNHYESLPHLLTPVVTNMKDAAAVLSNIVREMETRYELMGMQRARNLRDWNEIRVAAGEKPMPTILVLIDELADLMMVSPAEVEDSIIRLAQKSRAVGIHLVLATQRPSADVITGMIKANVPSRIAFAVSSQVDSRVVLDAGGRRVAARPRRHALPPGRAPRGCSASRAPTSARRRSSRSPTTGAPRASRRCARSSWSGRRSSRTPSTRTPTTCSRAPSTWWWSRGPPRCRCSSAAWAWATRAPDASWTPWSASAWCPATRAPSRARCWSGPGDVDRILERAVPAQEDDEEVGRRSTIGLRFARRAGLGSGPERGRPCSPHPMFEIGNTLREARLRRGLDILDCEAETKIRAKYLRAMEEEQFDLMPSPTYVRGFLRTYADFLDLDGRLVLDEYESRFGAYSLSQEGGGRPSRAAALRGRRAAPPRRHAPPRAAAQAPPHRAPAPVAGHRRRHGRRAPDLAGRRRVGHAHAGAARWSPPARPRRPTPAVTEPDTAATEAPVRPKRTAIVLAGTGVNGCWVQVRSKNADGRIVFEQILTPGTSKTFRVSEGIWVNASNPAELQVTVGGKSADLNSTSGGTWLITPTGAKSLD